jgi:WD40 repeat protein
MEGWPMSRYLYPTIFLVIIISLHFFNTASAGPRGIETSTVSLDEIKSSVASSLDLGNSNVEQTAVTIAKDYPGEYNINQVSEIYDTLVVGWYYFSDPSYKEKYKNANLTLQDGKTSSSVGMGDCDDFAILMASLINSLGGSTRIILASNATNAEGHAYCEVYLGEENDSQVTDLINWTKLEYNLKEVPGLNKIGNEVWMNLDWWADYPGGPYFEGDRRMVVWQSDKLISPKIVPIIDTMDSIAGWDVVKDNLGSNATISLAPARKGRGSAINITYNLKEGGWAGISKEVNPEVLSLINGLNFSYFGMDKQNTLELRLVDDNGTEFGASWKPATNAGKWQYLQALFDNFECMDSDEKCSAEDNLGDKSKVKKLEIVVSNRLEEGDTAGQGKVDMDHIIGVMNIPPGSPWVRVEEQRKIAMALDLASKSETIRNQPDSLIDSVTTAIESLRTYETVAGHRSLSQGLKLLPRPVADIDVFVDSIAFSPDGKLLAIACNNTTIIWSIETGKELTRLKSENILDYITFSPKGIELATLNRTMVSIWNITTNEIIRILGNDSINSIEFTPDGKKLATGSDDFTARVWDTDTGKELACMEHDNEVTYVTFSADGKRLATASFNYTTWSFSTAWLWDVETGRELARLELGYFAQPIAFSPDGYTLATVSEDNRGFLLWDVKTGRKLAKVETASIDQFCFSPDGTKLATATFGDIARIYDAKNGKEIAEMDSINPVEYVAFSMDGTKLATGSSDGTARIWDVNTSKELARMIHDVGVNSVTFSPDGTKLATATDYYAMVWTTKAGEELASMEHDGEVFRVAFSPDGKNLATASKDNSTRIWDVNTSKELIKMEHSGPVFIVTFSPDGKKLATASWDKTARIWDVENGKELTRLIHDRNVWFIAFSPNGRQLVSESVSELPKILDIYTGKELARMDPQDDAKCRSILNIAYSLDGNLLAISCMNEEERILDLNTGKELLRIEDGGAGFSSMEGEFPLAFSPDNKKLAVGYVGGTTKLWDLVTGKEMISVFNDSSMLVNFVAFSPDGNKLAAVTDDAVSVFDVNTGTELAYVKHIGLTSVAFSPDWKKLATGGADKTARIWDLQNSSEIRRLEHDDTVYSVAFSPNGKLLGTASKDRTARIWYISTQDQICDACSRLGCNLTTEEWRKNYCRGCYYN